MYKWGDLGSGGHAGVTRSHGSCVLIKGDSVEEGGLGLGRAGRGQHAVGRPLCSPKPGIACSNAADATGAGFS